MSDADLVPGGTQGGMNKAQEKLSKMQKEKKLNDKKREGQKLRKKLNKGKEGGGANQMSAKQKEQYKKMSPEEKEKFKEGYRGD